MLRSPFYFILLQALKSLSKLNNNIE